MVWLSFGAGKATIDSGEGVSLKSATNALGTRESIL